MKSCHGEGLVPERYGDKETAMPHTEVSSGPPGAVFLFYALYHTTCSFPTYIYMNQGNQM
jgi:hypothetical protein